MSKDEKCPFCNPHKDPEQNIVFEKGVRYWLKQPENKRNKLERQRVSFE